VLWSKCCLQQYKNTESAALKTQQCIPCVFLRHVAINKIKLLSVAMEKQQLALLSSYKIFWTAVSNISVLRSSCKVPSIYHQFQPHLDFLDRSLCKSPVSNFMKIHPTTLLHADLQKDSHNEVNRRFSQLMQTHLNVGQCTSYFSFVGTTGSDCEKWAGWSP